MSAHAKLSPSSAFRWTVCLASPGAIERARAEGLIGEDSSSAYADEGTKAHGIASSMLVNKLRDLDGSPPEMFAYLRDYARFVLDMGGELKSEVRVTLFYSVKDHGTVDILLVFRDATGKVIKIAVIDLKYGAGVSVYAFQNKQLATYAESAIRELELVDEVSGDTPVDLYIFQPRDRNDPEPVRWWNLTRSELAMFCVDIDAAAQFIAANPHNDRFVASAETCKFCPVAGICAARAKWVAQDLPVEVGNSMPLVGTLTREQRVRVLGAKKELIAWLEEVEAQEMADLLEGKPPLGFKLVEGKSNRQWSDEEAAKQLLRNHLSAEQTNPPSSLISPAAAEKLLKGIELSTKFENKFQSLITKPAGKPTLVPESDKRAALVTKIEFNNLNEAETLL